MKTLNLESRWPDLLDGLDDEARHEVHQIVAANWHEGWIPMGQMLPTLSK